MSHVTNLNSNLRLNVRLHVSAQLQRRQESLRAELTAVHLRLFCVGTARDKGMVLT